VSAVQELSPRAKAGLEKAKANAQARAQQRAERESRRRLGGVLVQRHGLRVLHEQPSAHVQGMSVAFKRVGRGTVRVSTAVCNRADQFNNDEGRFYAAQAFHHGHAVVLPIPGNWRDNVAGYVSFIFFSR
jgi:hypothetical protein